MTRAPTDYGAALVDRVTGYGGRALAPLALLPSGTTLAMIPLPSSPMVLKKKGKVDHKFDVEPSVKSRIVVRHPDSYDVGDGFISLVYESPTATDLHTTSEWIQFVARRLEVMDDAGVPVTHSDSGGTKPIVMPKTTTSTGGSVPLTPMGSKPIFNVDVRETASEPYYSFLTYQPHPTAPSGRGSSLSLVDRPDFPVNLGPGSAPDLYTMMGAPVTVKRMVLARVLRAYLLVADRPRAVVEWTCRNAVRLHSSGWLPDGTTYAAHSAVSGVCTDFDSDCIKVLAGKFPKAAKRIADAVAAAP